MSPKIPLYECEACHETFTIAFGDVYMIPQRGKKGMNLCDDCAKFICEAYAKTILHHLESNLNWRLP
jgi:hypothetical protein